MPWLIYKASNSQLAVVALLVKSWKISSQSEGHVIIMGSHVGSGVPVGFGPAAHDQNYPGQGDILHYPGARAVAHAQDRLQRCVLP